MNSNVTVDGEVFHVQTEDLAPTRPQLVSHVFREGGCVVKVTKLDYSRHRDRPDLHTVMQRVMKVFHAKVVRSLERQRLDSIPPCVNLRESIPPASSVSHPPAVRVPVSQTCVAVPIQEALPSSEPPPSVGSLWDRLVEGAQKERRTFTNLTHRDDDAPPSSTSWDRAVTSVRQATRTTRLEAPTVPADPASDAYGEGLVLFRNGDKEGALVQLARAVGLAPQNARYRAALRRALDAMDEV